MAHKLCFSHWLLACWLVVTVAEGQETVTPPGGSQHNVDSTDCQIFTLTPPPTTRKPVTRIQPVTRTPKGPSYFFPTWRPRVHIGFPNRPFLPPRCNHRSQYHLFFWPNRYFIPHYRYFPRRRFWRGSSSEEDR
ncbi:odontogenesis associated phosphoprotein [Desmodus rotundus]|uniref:odontogenesis associated phosphoprotein n=1 Tax=Desmodus rotundus TaxID=9430 RepID=UPI0023814CF8|nr:odontogenesis associated phosphoprotein [Desmodus rotundus]